MLSRKAACAAIIHLYKYVFYERDEKAMLNVAVCDDSDAFLQETEEEIPEKGGTGPQSGDNSNMALWMALMAVSSLGLAGILLYERKRRSGC